ncbi:MAG: polysaccharide deacetylase family protein [Flavobacteriaceae bacterium]|nr:polysaccharide deacetylase family protein [Flavobacteriaceae bacterium]
MLLVYTPKITPRLTYTFKHFFTRILLLDIQFTTKVDEFVAHNDLKITYAKQPLGTEFFIQSHQLLFEQGINDVEINVSKWQETKCFFKVGSKSAVPFDVFAASFYLLSRYEEYLPYVKDQFERFTAQESLAYKNEFLEKPVIDIWAFKVRELLKIKFKTYPFKERKFEYISTIDIDCAYAFRHKGVIRTLGGLAKDLFTLKLKNFWYRILVLLNFRKDPFDNFNWLLLMQKKYKTKTIFFFLMSEYTTYDKNISVNNSKFQSLIKSVADYATVGLHPSYFTMRNSEKLKREKKRLESIINTPITKSRQHYLRLDFPETYQNLVDLEIHEDYTMGYARHFGFRASTCTAFYFYDIEHEIQTPLKLIPFAVMDVTLKDYLQYANKKSFAIIIQLAKEVKKVNGTFITLNHNETFNKFSRFRGWKSMYEKVIKAINQIKNSEN